MSFCARPFFACRMSVRTSSARRTAASTSIACSWNGAVSLGSIVIVQKSGVAGSKIERAQPIFRRLDRRLGDDHRLVVPGHLRLRLDDVDRRHRADLHALLVVGQQPLGQVERLPLRGQVVVGERQIPVRVPDVARRLGDRLQERRIGVLAHLAVDLDLLPGVVDLEVAEQRLAEVDAEGREQLRVEGLEEVGRRDPRAVPGERVVAAGRQQLLDAERRFEPGVGDLVQAAGEGAGRRRGGRGAVQAR